MLTLPYIDVLRPVNRAHPLAHGLVSWWLVLPHLSGGGTRLVDLVGANHGTLTSMSATPSLTSGWGRTTRRQGGFGELRFDGTNDRVTVADAPNLSFGVATVDSAFSLTCAVWITSISATQGLLAKWASAGPEWVVYTAASTLFWELYNNPDDGGFAGRSVALTTGAHQAQWVFLAFTYTGSETHAGLRIYNRGVQIDTTNNGSAYAGMTNSTTVVSFGAYNGAANYLNGRMDDIRLYNRALSAVEVLALYQNSVAGCPGLLNRLELPWGQVAALAYAPLPGVGTGQAVHRASRY